LAATLEEGYDVGLNNILIPEGDSVAQSAEAENSTDTSVNSEMPGIKMVSAEGRLLDKINTVIRENSEVRERFKNFPPKIFL
jgi:hypothetical protein